MKSTLRLILPLPLTLALAALCGVLVEATPNGVNGQATGLALCLCSVVLALVAIRRGTQPVTWKSTDFRPTAAEVLRAPFGRRRALEEAPPLGADLLLTVAVLIALAIAGLWVVRALDRSADPVPYTALTGRVVAAAAPRDGVTRARVEMTVVNDAPRAIRPVLRIGTDPALRGTRRLEQVVRVPARSSRRVGIALDAAVRRSGPGGAVGVEQGTGVAGGQAARRLRAVLAPRR